MNYEFNLLHHVGVVDKRLRVAAAAVAAHEEDNNNPSGPTGPPFGTNEPRGKNGSNVF